MGEYNSAAYPPYFDTAYCPRDTYGIARNSPLPVVVQCPPLTYREWTLYGVAADLYNARLKQIGVLRVINPVAYIGSSCFKALPDLTIAA